MNPDVQHDPVRRRFFVMVDQHEAFLDYAVVEEGTLDLAHTFTPPELRGRGLAERIVLRALEYARGKNLRVVASCWYAQRILDRDEGA